MLEDLIKKIEEAKVEAYKKGIQTNAVVLNDKFDYCREFAFMCGNCMYHIPPMILGKEVIVAPLPEDYTFALTQLEKGVNVYEELEHLKSLLKKYVRVLSDNTNEVESLSFKGLSSQRNKKDFEDLKHAIQEEN